MERVPYRGQLRAGHPPYPHAGASSMPHSPCMHCCTTVLLDCARVAALRNIPCEKRVCLGSLGLSCNPEQNHGQPHRTPWCL